MFWKNLNHKDVRVYQNRYILSFKFLKLNLSTKRSTVFIKIVDYFSKRVDPSVKKGWPFRQKRLTFSSKRVDLLVNKKDMSILTHALSLWGSLSYKGIMLIDTINRHQVFIKGKIKSIDLLPLRKKCIFEA